MRQRKNFEDKLNIADDDENSEVDEKENFVPVLNQKTNDEFDKEQNKQTLIDDYQFAKKTLKKNIIAQRNIIDFLIEDLEFDPNPRKAEVLARMFETVGSNTEQLLHSSKTVAEICKMNKEKEDEPKLSGGTTIQNAIFVGSLEDVLKLKESNISALNKGENND